MFFKAYFSLYVCVLYFVYDYIINNNKEIITTSTIQLRYFLYDCIKSTSYNRNIFATGAK